MPGDPTTPDAPTDATDLLWLKQKEFLLVVGGPLVTLTMDAGHS